MFDLFGKRKFKLPKKMPSDFCLSFSTSNGFSGYFLMMAFMEGESVEFKSENRYEDEKFHLVFSIPKAIREKLYSIVYAIDFLSLEIPQEDAVPDTNRRFIKLKWKGYESLKESFNVPSGIRTKFNEMFDKLFELGKTALSFSKKRFFVELEPHFWFKDGIEFYAGDDFKSASIPDSEDISDWFEKEKKIELSIDNSLDKIAFSPPQIVEITPGIFKIRISSDFGKSADITIDFSNADLFAGIRFIGSRVEETRYELLPKK